MSQYAIVAIGYNRSNCMERLLSSLAGAYYGAENIDLIVSIDNSGTDDAEKCARNFRWEHGTKRVVTYPERQGLRKHILQCGDFVKEYDAIAVFEDDLIAAPGFYQYMKETVEKYRNDDRIAGISLYNHLWNVNVNLPFEPDHSGYDVYFLQYAQSWGQIWMKKQWEEFAVWYKENDEEFGTAENIPDYVSGWPKTSWLKYHIKYCIEKNKFFVYPYNALSTCFSEIGEHCAAKDTHLQVPMMWGMKKGYSLPKIDAEDAVFYDAFFERIIKGEVCGLAANDICLDLYGSRKSYMEKRYIISCKKLPYKVLASYGLELRTQEENVLRGIEGNNLFLYDSNLQGAGIHENAIARFRYYFRLYAKTKLMARCVVESAVGHIKNKFKKY